MAEDSSSPLDNLTLPGEIAPADPSRVLAIAADIRRQMADPASPVYANRPDLVALTELNLRATMLRAGIDETPMTPQSLAEQQHDAAFATEMPANLVEMIDNRMEAIKALGEPVMRERADDLRRVLGSAAYDQFVADAQAGGQSLPPAAKADAHTLRLLAAQGRWRRAKEATRPRRY